MFKSVSLFIGCSMFALACVAAPTTLDCQTSSKLEANLDELEKVTKVADGCAAPEKVDYVQICAYSKEKKRASSDSEFTYLFEQKLLQMSCAVEGKDSPEVIKLKINKMWDTYRTKFSCDSLGFHIPNGNVLKFTLNFNFPDFIYYMVDNYDLDMDFKDPADNKTVFDYLDEEIANTKMNGPGRIREMKEVKAALEEQKRKKQQLAKLK